VGRRTVVVHVLPAAEGSGTVRVGFIVNKAVGGAVQRNLVRRRLRAVMVTRLGDLPAGSLTVVRALPAAATASYDELLADVTAGLGKVLDAR
jgi:ribonuclease P protein component